MKKLRTVADECAVFIPPIDGFVEDAISASDFEGRYLRLIRRLSGSLHISASRPIDRLFLEVDALWANDATRHPDDIDEHHLLDAARAGLSELVALHRVRD